MADSYFVADQKVYTPAIPPTDGFTPVDAITFKHNGKPGVPIKVALDSCKSCGKDCTGLEGGGATAPIVAKGDKVSLRLEVCVFQPARHAPHYTLVNSGWGASLGAPQSTSQVHIKARRRSAPKLSLLVK